MANQLTLAVAGSRKTQGIIDYCATIPADRKVIILTFTKSNQMEIDERIRRYIGDRPDIVVMGWFTFLLRDFARPFIPFKFPEKRINGFNYEGRPYFKTTGIGRFLDSNDAVYACELGRLASELIAESDGALIHRLECIYDEILIDEVQDLSGHDWEILDVILSSSVNVKMVGDIRQSVLSTNPRSGKNKKYKYADAIHWFREREKKGVLSIVEKATTWRCHPDIASFSDSIFDSHWGFPATQSENNILTGHDGVFLVREKDASKYIDTYIPKCLRSSANSGKKFKFDYINFKVSKGQTFERVLIVPTQGILNFIKSGKFLEPVPASSFYVAVTRAKQSVAIVVPDSGEYALPIWKCD